MTQEMICDSMENVKLQATERIALVTLNRPGALNAINQAMLRELTYVMDFISGTDDIGGLIITGAGRAFAAGADVSQMRNYGAEEGRKWSEYAQSVFDRIENLEKPVIAAVNGYAFGGGCELALSCDIRIASKMASFSQPEVNLGLIPCFGGTQRLTRLVGAGMAKEIIFSARQVSPKEAKTIGLVNAVVEPGQLIPTAMDMMKVILNKAPQAVKYAKSAINQGINMDFHHALEMEKDMAALTFATDDAREGMTAFLEKRKAVFRNR
ncbi:MAG: enoyl-CoA hydratase-related protein [Clostridiales bacterium]|nr:enoyl-CoA hydratase-related protein [Clostridiales bacterium]